MENLKIHSNVYDKLDTFYNNNNIPNIIFHGASGSGKKTILYNSNIYEEGYSCLDLMDYIQSLDSYNKSDKSNFMLCFHKVKSKFKNEKFLILYMLDFIFIREDKSIHNI